MEDWQGRTRLLIGDEGIHRLSQAHILVAGIGGVGGYVVESLARAGVGRLTLIDHDYVSVSNRNRQLVALTSTLDTSKVSVMKARIAEINTSCRVDIFATPICDDASDWLSQQQPDRVVDAIDSVKCKIALLKACVERNIPVYSSMGAGKRLDARAVRVMDIMDTQGCGLARVVRHGLRKAGIGRGISCVASMETPVVAVEDQPCLSNKQRLPNGTVSYMPAIFGVLLAGEVLRDYIHYPPKG